MLKQPDLGKRIAELRKVKGLTQEELVEKCNLNVRTLQRIESGEVTPRSYTLKMIFTALEFDIHQTLNGGSGIFEKIKSVINSWPGQIYRYTLDLFNFKTNVMRKIIILSIPFISVFLLLLFHSITAKAQKDKMVIRNKFLKEADVSGFMRCYNAGQIDSVSSRYLEKSYMVPDQGAPILTRKDIQHYYSQLYAQGIRFAEIKSTFMYISDSIAIDRGVWNITVNTVPVGTGTYLTQWHFYHGNWWIENEISTLTPATELTAKE